MQVVGWRIGGSSTYSLAAEQRGEVQDHLRLHQFCRAVVIMPGVVVIILIYVVVVIFSSHMYAQQVFLALFTGVLNTIANVCRRGVEAERFQLVYGWCLFLA